MHVISPGPQGSLRAPLTLIIFHVEVISGQVEGTTHCQPLPPAEPRSGTRPLCTPNTWAWKPVAGHVTPSKSPDRTPVHTGVTCPERAMRSMGTRLAWAGGENPAKLLVSEGCHPSRVPARSAWHSSEAGQAPCASREKLKGRCLPCSSRCGQRLQTP